MKVVPLLYAVAMSLVPVMGFAVPAGSLRWHQLGIGRSIFIERGSRGKRRFRQTGRQDVYLHCANFKVWEGSAIGARSCAA